jgi:hypothetical protein
MIGSTNSGDYSDLKLQWSRPNDAISGSVNSCIESYNVQIVRAVSVGWSLSGQAGFCLCFAVWVVGSQQKPRWGCARMMQQ